MACMNVFNLRTKHTDHSTETALLAIANDILLSLDMGDKVHVPIVTGLVSGI